MVRKTVKKKAKNKEIVFEPPKELLVFDLVTTTSRGDYDNLPNLSRARIPGGWLLLLGKGHLTFVPDKSGAWEDPYNFRV